MGVIGPSKHLPGNIIDPVHSRCEEHPDRPAVKSIVGETDSFGSETQEVCQECLDKYRQDRDKKLANPDPDDFFDCDGCSKRDETVKPARDPEEGMAGPVYYWCAECRKDVFSKWSE